MFTNTCVCSKKCNIGRKECILFMFMQLKNMLEFGFFLLGIFVLFKPGCLSAHRFLDWNISTPNTLKGYGAHFQWEKIIIPLS